MALPIKVEHYEKLSTLLENGYIPKTDETFMYDYYLPVLYISHEGKFVMVNDCADGYDMILETKDCYKLTYNFK